MAKKDHPETLGLQLTQAERTLLQELFVLDEELEEQISQRPTREPIMLTLDELDELGEGIAAEIGNTKSSKKRRTLCALADKIEDLLSLREEQRPSLLEAETRIIKLPDFSSSPLKVEDAAMDYLQAFIDNIEDICGECGIDIDGLLETLKPTRIELDEKIELRLTRGQRQMVLDMRGVNESIAACVRDTSARQQKAELTLGQINELENAVARIIQQTTDRKAKRKLQILDGELINMQVKYTVQDDSESSGPQMFASPSDMSRGALVRKLLAEMLEARRPKDRSTQGRTGSARKSPNSRG